MFRSDRVGGSDRESSRTVTDRVASVAAESGAALRVDPRSLAASDVWMAVTDGRPDTLSVRPRVVCTWAGLDRRAVEVGATVLAALPAEDEGFDPVATELLPLDTAGREGSADLPFRSARCVLANTPLGPVDFASYGPDDLARERTLRLRLVVDLVDEDGLPIEGDAATSDWVVRVSTDEGSATFLDH